MMPDDSASMTEPSSKHAGVIAGHNELLDAMATSRDRGRTMLQTRLLNGTVLNPFKPLARCTHLTTENYPCTFGTPLFGQTLILLGAVLAKAEELVGAGAKVRTATLIMTDGESTEQNKGQLAGDVAYVVRDMRKVGDHIVAGMSFIGANGQKFDQPFLDMGIDPRHIFSATSREDVLEVFRIFRRSAIAELTGGTATRRAFEL
jgi:hypothetical protein